MEDGSGSTIRLSSILNPQSSIFPLHPFTEREVTDERHDEQIGQDHIRYH